MIISLDEAMDIDENITQEDLDGFEVAIRKLTNNNFQNIHVRYKNVEFTGSDTIEVKGKVEGLRVGDTIQVNESNWNDGLYTVVAIADNLITVRDGKFFTDANRRAMITKIEYPADVKLGMRKLIEYDIVMRGKVGIKSESIARMSVTYFDVNSTENIDGYPSALLSFVSKYEKMRW